MPTYEFSKGEMHLIHEALANDLGRLSSEIERNERRIAELQHDIDNVKGCDVISHKRSIARLNGQILFLKNECALVKDLLLRPEIK